MSVCRQRTPCSGPQPSASSCGPSSSCLCRRSRCLPSRGSSCTAHQVTPRHTASQAATDPLERPSTPARCGVEIHHVHRLARLEAVVRPAAAARLAGGPALAAARIRLSVPRAKASASWPGPQSKSDRGNVRSRESSSRTGSLKVRQSPPSPREYFCPRGFGETVGRIAKPVNPLLRGRRRN